VQANFVDAHDAMSLMVSTGGQVLLRGKLTMLQWGKARAPPRPINPRHINAPHPIKKDWVP